MKKLNTITLGLLFITGSSFAQNSVNSNSDYYSQADAPTNMVCKLKNDKLNTCIDVSSLDSNKLKSIPKKPKTTEVYRVRQANGIWAYSDSKTDTSEVLDLKSERMTRNITVISSK